MTFTNPLSYLSSICHFIPALPSDHLNPNQPPPIRPVDNSYSAPWATGLEGQLNSWLDRSLKYSVLLAIMASITSALPANDDLICRLPFYSGCPDTMDQTIAMRISLAISTSPCTGSLSYMQRLIGSNGTPSSLHLGQTFRTTIARGLTTLDPFNIKVTSLDLQSKSEPTDKEEP